MCKEVNDNRREDKRQCKIEIEKIIRENRIHGLTEGHMDEWMHGHMDEWWVNGWTNGWANE